MNTEYPYEATNGARLHVNYSGSEKNMTGTLARSSVRVFYVIWPVRPRVEISHQLINQIASTLIECSYTYGFCCCAIMNGVQYNIYTGFRRLMYIWRTIISHKNSTTIKRS